MATYNLIFSKRIHGCFASTSSTDVHLEYSIACPFVPVPGMEFVDGDWSAVAASVSWHVREKFFHIYTEDDKEIYNAQLNNRPHRPIAEIVAEYVEEGWYVENR